MVIPFWRVLKTYPHVSTSTMSWFVAKASVCSLMSLPIPGPSLFPLSRTYVDIHQYTHCSCSGPYFTAMSQSCPQIVPFPDLLSVYRGIRKDKRKNFSLTAQLKLPFNSRSLMNSSGGNSVRVIPLRTGSSTPPWFFFLPPHSSLQHTIYPAYVLFLTWYHLRPMGLALFL